MSNLIDLFKQGHTTLYRKEEPHARFTFHVIDKEKGTHGPWVTIEDHSTDAGVLEPPKILITELPYEGWFTAPTKEYNQ